MNNYQETFNTWNKIASLYQETFMDLELYTNSYDRFIELLKPSAEILEIGCGPGNISSYLLNKNNHFKIKGIDVAENMVELARTNNPNAEFALMDIRKLHELNQPFDGIISGFCIPYISKTDCSKLIQDCSKLLNDCGILYISFVEGSDDQSGFISGSSGDRMYFYFHQLAFISSKLQSTGFKVLDVIHVEYTKSDESKEVHTILIAQKTETTK